MVNERVAKMAGMKDCHLKSKMDFNTRADPEVDKDDLLHPRIKKIR